MRIRRGLLFAGLFLIPLGGMTLLVRAGTVSADSLAEVWRLWPLILIGFGVALLLGRSRAASLGTAIAALTLGVLVGGAIASGGAIVGSVGQCGLPGDTDQHLDQAGTFDRRATVAIDLRCGSAELTTSNDSGWMVRADYRGPVPIVTGSVDRLEVRDPDTGQARHDAWTIAASTELLKTVDASANAASVTLRLGSSHPDLVRVDANAGDILVDGGNASIARVEVQVNAGRARITLGSVWTTGSIAVNAGAVELCAPADLGLRLHVNDQLTFITNLADRGLSQAGTLWVRPASDAMLPVIELDIQGNVASFTLDPDGGCE
jgi:hypothetical protein